MSTALCADCGLIYLPLRFRRNRVPRCPGCKEAYRARQKTDCQRKRNERRNEVHDISEAEIDARFTAALKEARRQSSESLEPYRSYGWLYREPRS